MSTKLCHSKQNKISKLLTKKDKTRQNKTRTKRSNQTGFPAFSFTHFFPISTIAFF